MSTVLLILKSVSQFNKNFLSEGCRKVIIIITIIIITVYFLNDFIKTSVFF